MKSLLVLLLAGIALTACESRTAEQIGAAEAEKKLGLIKGASDVVVKDGEMTAEAVAQGLGKLVTGFGSGLDKSFDEVEITLSDTIAPTVLDATRAQRMNASQGKNGLHVYLASQDGYTGGLRLIALSGGREIGRSDLDVKLDKGDAQYVDFVFDERTELGIVKSYRLETKG